MEHRKILATDLYLAFDKKFNKFCQLSQFDGDFLKSNLKLKVTGFQEPG